MTSHNVRFVVVIRNSVRSNVRETFSSMTIELIVFNMTTPLSCNEYVGWFSINLFGNDELHFLLPW